MPADTSKSPASNPIGAESYRTDLANLFSESVKALTEARAAEQPGSRLFFPDGIQHIRLALTVGPKDSPLFSAELEVTGDKSKAALQAPDITSHLTQIANTKLGAVSPITQACVDHWPDNKNFCNKFVIAVAQTFKVNLSGQADDILRSVAAGPWKQLLDGDGAAASAEAASGRLVVAGLSGEELGDEHGHVVIVVEPNGPLAFGKYPYAYWGSENASIRDKGGIGTTINWSFAKDVRDKIHYSSIEI